MPYLFADPALTETWRQRLAGFQGFKVGIGWQGNPKYVADNLRSIPLRHFAPWPACRASGFSACRRGPARSKIAAVSGRLAGRRFRAGFRRPARDLHGHGRRDAEHGPSYHLGHRRGPPGRRRWACRFGWRSAAPATGGGWTEREDSPWYPTMRLFRQRGWGTGRESSRRLPPNWPVSFAGSRSGVKRENRGPSRPALQAPLSAGELLDRISILRSSRRNH